MTMADWPEKLVGKLVVVLASLRLGDRSEKVREFSDESWGIR